MLVIYMYVETLLSKTSKVQWNVTIPSQETSEGLVFSSSDLKSNFKYILIKQVLSKYDETIAMLYKLVGQIRQISKQIFRISSVMEKIHIYICVCKRGLAYINIYIYICQQSALDLKSNPITEYLNPMIQIRNSKCRKCMRK